MLILRVNVAVEVCLHNRSLERFHQLHCIRLIIILMDNWTRKTKQKKTHVIRKQESMNGEGRGGGGQLPPQYSGITTHGLP